MLQVRHMWGAFLYSHPRLRRDGGTEKVSQGDLVHILNLKSRDFSDKYAQVNFLSGIALRLLHLISVQDGRVRRISSRSHRLLSHRFCSGNLPSPLLANFSQALSPPSLSLATRLPLLPVHPKHCVRYVTE